MHVMRFYIFPGFAERNTHGSSLATCSFTCLPVNSVSYRQASTWDFRESCEIFWGVWIELDFSSHMGVLLGHVINMDYKFSIGKMVLNLLPPTLLFWKCLY